MLALVAVAGFLPLGAADSSPPGQKAGESPVESAPYIIGVARLVDRGLPPAAASFPCSWSLLLVDLLADLPPRMPIAPLVEDQAARLEARRRLEAGASLASRLDELAARELDPGLSPEKRKSALEAARAKVDEARKALAATYEPPIPKAAASAAAPRTTALWKDHEAGKLAEADPRSPADAAVAQKLSLLLCGSVESAAGGYLLVSVLLWDAELGRIVLDRREFARPEDPAPAELAEEIRDYVAGSPYGRLAIAPVPASAALAINGTESEERTVYVFEPSRIEAEITAPGFLGVREAFDLAPGERKTYAPVLLPVERATVGVSVDPPGARLFLDGLPVGSAPLDLETGIGGALLRAEAPGFESERLLMDPATASGTVFMKLAAATDDGSSGRLARAKDAFYRSLGFLVLGMAGQALVRGMSEGLDTAALGSSDPSVETRAMLAKGLRIGVLSITGLLGANAGWKLSDYIGAAR
jgi:hypothetical protein